MNSDGNQIDDIGNYIEDSEDSDNLIDRLRDDLILRAARRVRTPNY